MANKTHTYSKLAEQDLIDIYLYSVRTWGQKQADSYDAGLKHAIGMLVDFPDIGRACDEVKVGYRRFEHKHHTVFYRQRKTDIFIVRILHESMDIRSRLSRSG